MSTATMPKRRADAEPQEPTVPITIRFPESLRTRAIAVGKAEDRTFASLVIYALRRYVNDRESLLVEDDLSAQAGQARRFANRLGRTIGVAVQNNRPSAEIEQLQKEYREAEGLAIRLEQAVATSTEKKP